MAGGPAGRPGGPALPVDVAQALHERLNDARVPEPPGSAPTRELPTAADTEAFGRELAAVLQPGDLLVLRGPLGAGKTVLARGIGDGLGVEGPVTSPTFVIARWHGGGRLPFVHVDAYRLGSVAEVDDLDLDVDLDDAVTVIEWGEGVAEQLSSSYLVVDVERRPDDVRVVTLEPHGPAWTDRV